MDRKLKSRMCRGASAVEYIVILGAFILAMIAVVGKYGDRIERIIMGKQKGKMAQLEDSIGADLRLSGVARGDEGYEDTWVTISEP